MNKTWIHTVNQKFKAAEKILVVSHIRPDGDAVGSALGLGLSLQLSGKQVQMVLSDGVPPSFRHLSGADQLRHHPVGEFDLICVVDCSDMQRTGNALDGYPQPDLNIDHHITNLHFARINLVNPQAVATAEILTELILAIGLPMPPPVAAALLTGIITDTLGFRTSNIQPDTLRLAAKLMETGVDMPELYRRALITRSFEATRFWGAGLSKLERDGRLVWATLSMDDRKAAGYNGRDDADLINVLASIEDADIALIFVEQPNHHVKVSWRAQSGFDVSQVALKFGGGGHPPASGADITGNLDDVQARVLAATRNLLYPEPARQLES
ncbi:MAG: bifunctional oligoribonuclease/PAP phosphatase NrnA [Anaerolineales bacterium]|jgi:phosphoesterase RecJ-like protein